MHVRLSPPDTVTHHAAGDPTLHILRFLCLSVRRPAGDFASEPASSALAGDDPSREESVEQEKHFLERLLARPLNVFCKLGFQYLRLPFRKDALRIVPDY